MDNQNEFLNEIFTEGKNEAIRKYNNGNYKEAVHIFSDILKSEMNTIDKSILLCNRAACYIKMEEYNKSLIDIIETVRIKPNWGKAWGRLGASLYGLERFDKAITAYKKANELDPSYIYDNMIKMLENIDNRFTISNDVINKILTNDNLINKMLTNDKLINKIKDENIQKLFFSDPIQLLKDKELVDIMKQYL